MDHQLPNNTMGIQSLIELGMNGHYPLFPAEWFTSLNFKNNKIISKSDQEKTRKIINRLSQHKTLDRKRTLLYSLSEKERELFLKVFFSMVENKLLGQQKQLH